MGGKLGTASIEASPFRVHQIFTTLHHITTQLVVYHLNILLTLLIGTIPSLPGREIRVCAQHKLVRQSPVV